MRDTRFKDLNIGSCFLDLGSWILDLASCILHLRSAIIINNQHNFYVKLKKVIY
jgi:hypothetical protein